MGIAGVRHDQEEYMSTIDSGHSIYIIQDNKSLYIIHDKRSLYIIQDNRYKILINMIITGQVLT